VTTPATVADIAARAGVGTATVDRVLNQRPGVNPQTMRRVMEVVAELGTPAPRGRPRQSADLRFAYVLPAAESPFTALVERQIAQTAGDFRHQHITEVTHRLDFGDPAAVEQALAPLASCQGVALLAPDVPAVKLAVAELVKAGVHVVTLFSDVAGSMRETHVGADNRAAGRTAALLLGRMAPPGRSKLLLVSQATRLSAEIERRIGFAQVIEERFAHLSLQRLPDIPADDAGAARAFSRFVKSGVVDPRAVAGLYAVGSGVAGLVRALNVAGLSADAVGIVAHDASEEHRTLLARGSLSYVLDQDIHYCVLAAARVLRALCENVRGALNVVQPRVEILTAENLL
jgi:LacI family transcriptional regulator